MLSSHAWLRYPFNHKNNKMPYRHRQRRERDHQLKHKRARTHTHCPNKILFTSSWYCSRLNGMRACTLLLLLLLLSSFPKRFSISLLLSYAHDFVRSLLNAKCSCRTQCRRRWYLMLSLSTRLGLGSSDATAAVAAVSKLYCRPEMLMDNERSDT